MKIAIPVTEGKLAAHFGHCEKFAFVEVDKDAGQVLTTELLDPPPHAPGVMPRWVAEQGANLIIAGGMGMRAKELFEERGVDVLVGAPVTSSDELAAAYLAGTLQTGGNACDH